MLVMEGGGDMLILLTGVGGALSALGRDIPAKAWAVTSGQRVQWARLFIALLRLRPMTVSDSTIVR